MDEHTIDTAAFSNALADSVEKAAIWTVTVQTGDEYPSSGIVFQPERVLTAAHLVDDLDKDEHAEIVFADGDTAQANVRGYNPIYDLALLEYEAEQKQVATYAQDNARESQARSGELALALARPSSDGIQSSLGVVNVASGTYRAGYGTGIEGVMRSDAARFPGYSGGPLIDVEGALYGVNVYGVRRHASLTVPISVIHELLPALEAGKKPETGYLGVRTQIAELPDALATEIGISDGLLIVGIEDDSPAVKAGLLVGDIIIRVAEKTTSEHGALLEALGGFASGDEVSVDIVRGGDRQTVRVVVGSRPVDSSQREKRSPRFGKRGHHHGGKRRR